MTGGFFVVLFPGVFHRPLALQQPSWSPKQNPSQTYEGFANQQD